MKKIFLVICLCILSYGTANATSETGRDGALVSFANNTIVDSETGLMWTQSDNGEDIGWLDASLMSGNFTLATYSDWRIPTKAELGRLFTKKANPSGLRISPLFNVESIVLYASETKTCKVAFANLLNASFNWVLKSRRAFARVLLVRDTNSQISTK